MENAIAPAQLEDPEAVSRAALSPLHALGHLPAVVVDEESRDRLAFGQTVDAPENMEGGHITVACDGRLVAIAEVRAGALRPRKVFLP